MDWSKDKDNQQHVEELKRHLHTLKGGARMAGITAMGDLSHELETLLIGLDDGRIASSVKIDELLQLSIDELHHMRDAVIAGKQVTTATALEKQIHQINVGEAVPAGETAAPPLEEEEELATDESVSVEFTMEPEETVSMVIVDTPLNDEIAEIKKPSEAPEPPPAVAKKKTEKKAAPKKVAKKAKAAPEPVEEEEPVELKAVPVQAAEGRQEFARIDAELLEDLLNAAGEISIYHSRLSQQISSIEFHVDEFEQTVSRLREQLRKLEIETEAQIMHSHQDTLVASKEFDPLEMDRYSNIQQLSRALSESANDMGSLKDLLQSVTSEAETLLVQQSRVTAELQDGLMRTRDSCTGSGGSPGICAHRCGTPRRSSQRCGRDQYLPFPP